MAELGQAASAFAQTLWATRAGRSRAGFEAWQARALTRWLARDLPRVAAYADIPAGTGLGELPVTDKAMLMARFQDYNVGRISAADGWSAHAGTGEIDGISIGASTGTSGNRSLYAITAPERYRWLGTILAKTIPGFLWRAERVAVVLPQDSTLYQGANRTGRIRLRFFDLRQGVESWLAALVAFAPTTIVAPPRVLRHLAQHAPHLHPRRLYAGGETLDPVDRQIVEARFGLRLGQIYMATEGLFGVTCAHGRLHLAEDANVFEFEPVGEGLVSPLVTSFRRSFQIIARYRMNDLLRLSDAQCACGSPLRVVDEVVGRMDDAFVFARDGQGVPVLVTPDVMRNAVLDAARDISDFRIIREPDGAVTLALHPELAEASAAAARNALAALFARRGLAPELTLRRDPMSFQPAAKLRRVENRCKGEV